MSKQAGGLACEIIVVYLAKYSTTPSALTVANCELLIKFIIPDWVIDSDDLNDTKNNKNDDYHDDRIGKIIK